MQLYPFHVFICAQQKPEGLPCCSQCGSGALLEAMRAAVARHGLADTVQITGCASLGLCERGPNLVVYPEGVWYSGVQAGDAEEIVTSHFVRGRIVERLVNNDAAALRADIAANRDRMQAAARAREAVGALPEPLLETIRGFQQSRAILTAIELDVFTAVGGGACAPEAARKIGADPRATEMLLNALAAMGLLTKREGTFANTPLSARFLAAGGQDDARTELLNTQLWGSWATLTEAVRAGTAVGYEARDSDWTAGFIAAMHRSANERLAGVIAALDLAGVRRMLDVGGGSGAYSIAFAKAVPELRADILELPPVAPIAERYCAAAGVQDRVRARPGDLRQDPFEPGYDLVLVSSICHILNEAENRDLLRRCFDACAPGGQIVIQDYILEPDKAAPKTGALFALTMLVATEHGATYSGAEYTAWLTEAGFTGIRLARLPGPTALVIGVRAPA